MYLAGKGQLPTNNSIPLQIVNVLGNFPAIETTKSYIHLLKKNCVAQTSDQLSLHVSQIWFRSERTEIIILSSYKPKFRRQLKQHFKTYNEGETYFWKF